MFASLSAGSRPLGSQARREGHVTEGERGFIGRHPLARPVDREQQRVGLRARQGGPVLQMDVDSLVGQVSGEAALPVVVPPGGLVFVEQDVDRWVRHALDVLPDEAEPCAHLLALLRRPSTPPTLHHVATTATGRPCQCSVRNGSGGPSVSKKIAPKASGASGACFRQPRITSPSSG